MLESKKDKALGINEMFYLGQLIILMLRSIFLKELGFDDDFIKNITRKGELKYQAELKQVPPDDSDKTPVYYFITGTNTDNQRITICVSSKTKIITFS
jgi:uncharacterized protein YpmB